MSELRFGATASAANNLEQLACELWEQPGEHTAALALAAAQAAGLFAIASAIGDLRRCLENRE